MRISYSNHYKGCESETDTEEFEKVGQSPLELNFDKQIPSPRPGMQDASTSTEHTLSVSSTQSNTESFTNIKNPSLESIDESSNLKHLTSNVDSCFNSHYQQSQGNANNLLALSKSPVSPNAPHSPKEVHANSPNSPVLGHQPANDFINDEFYIDESLPSSLSIEAGNSQGEFVKQLDTANNVVALLQHYESLSSSWENLIVEKDNTGREIVEVMKRDFETSLEDLKKIERLKNEQIENLLLEKTALEAEVLKTCSDINELQENRRLQEKEVEKEKGIKEATDRLNREHKAEIENISSLPNTALLLQMTENFELDKEKAVKEALQKEKEKWEKLLNDTVKQMEAKFKEEREVLLQDVARKISEEKDKQIEVLREREKNLNLECIKYKSTIQQLAECEAESHDSDLLEKINNLEKQKECLEEELEKVKSEKIADLAASVAVCEGKVDATTSPVRHREGASKSDIPRSYKLNIDNCKAGDHVMVLWDADHESFRIIQENKHMYFLHCDYLDGLGLESQNRYKVRKGTKFFRVKVKPVTFPGPSRDVTQSFYHPRNATHEAAAMSQREGVPFAAFLSVEGPPVHLESCEEKDECDGLLQTDPEIIQPETVETTFAEDSGIVDNIEQATAALEEANALETKDEQSESSDRCSVCSTKLGEQHAYISSTWLEMMISRVFSKSFQNE
ncbi:hypothetical protein NQ318_008958 [Aromia moschata]|uniref:RB1-inducible coiled-coil protein 1 n=1 Tax=Aromia moschata TaxID=1265417 RepID=A0AAV8ZCJ6_9CUCU|nr:hypothetical protein NQ318_008958 [Aromia moschata]